jgi:prepilin-type N-terminal cleavage/methylation domain-containing protein
MRTIRGAAASERGETLLELLVAVVIMGIGLVAVVGGLVVSIHASDIHRKQATAGTAARDAVESIENWVAAGHFPICGDTAGYAAVAVPSFPAGYTKTVTASCAGLDAGLQKVKITVSSADVQASESVAFVVRKAYGPSDPPC